MITVKQILLSSLLGVCMISTAQKIKWGRMYNDTTKAQVHKMMGYDSNGFYITRYRSPHPHDQMTNYAHIITLEKYDLTGTRLFAKEITAKEQGESDSYMNDGIFFMKDNMLTLMYTPDAKTAYILKVNNDGSIDDKKTLLGPTETSSKWISKGILPDHRYFVAVSGDKTTLLTFYRTGNIIKAKAIKEDLTVLWSKDIEVPFVSKDMWLEGATLSGNKAYFFYSIAEGKNTSFSLFCYDNATGNAQKIDANPIADKNMTEMKFETDNKGNVILMGLYEKTKDQGAVGAFLIKLDNTDKIVANTAYPFSDGILSNFGTPENLKKGDGIAECGIKDVFCQDDNSIIFASEMNSNSVSHGFNTTGAPGPRVATTESYDYYDGVVMKINPDGSQGWTIDLHKAQDMSSGSVSAPFIESYGISIVGDKVYMIFNDNKKNAGLSAADAEKSRHDLKMCTPDGGASYQALMLETIDLATGSLIRKQLGDQYANSKLLVYANFYLPLADKVIVYRSDIFKSNKDEGQFGQFIIQ